MGLLGMVWIAAALAGEPVELRPGVEYAAGTRVQSTELGLSFEVPAGWKGGVPPGADAMLLASDVHPGLVVVLAQAGARPDEVASALSQPLPIDAGLILQPTGASTRQESRLTQRYEAEQPGVGPVVGVAEARITDGGGAIAFVAVGPVAEAARYGALVQALSGSVREVKRPSLANPTVPTGPLAERLSGRQLYYLKVQDGFSDTARIDLCRDGTVVRRSNSSGMSTGGVGTLTYAGQGGGRGAWTVTGDTVVVTWEDGSTGSWPIKASGSGLTVDLANWWVQDGGC